MKNKKIKDLLKLSKRLASKEMSRMLAVTEDGRTKNEIDQVIYNHSLSKKEASAACQLSVKTFDLRWQEAEKKGVIPPVRKVGKQWKFTLDHVHAMMRWLQVPTFADHYPDRGCEIINVENQKGGTGKSMTAVSLATAMALPLRDRMRICLVDLDPQGSLRNFLIPSAALGGTDLLSAVDLMLKDSPVYQQMVGSGHTHADIVKESIQNTHIPNLKILPAFPEDERFSANAWLGYHDTNRIDHIKYLKTEVIDIIRDDFDIILIDTGPHINPLVWSANYASTGLLIPCTPHKLDYLSTINFIRSLPEMLDRNLPGDYDGYRWFRIIATNFDDEHGRDLAVLNEMKDDLGRNLMNSVIKRSQAFELASRNYRTVFDIRKSDGLVPPKQLDKALDSVRDVVRELKLMMQEEWLDDAE